MKNQSGLKRSPEWGKSKRQHGYQGLSSARMQREYRTLKEGQRWCRLVVLEIVPRKQRLEVEVGVWEEVEINWYRLECDCGRVFEVSERHFTGKRRMQDCGRCERVQVVGVKIFPPNEVVRHLRVYVVKYGMSKKRAMERLIVEYSGWDWKGGGEFPRECIQPLTGLLAKEGRKLEVKMMWPMVPVEMFEKLKEVRERWRDSVRGLGVGDLVLGLLMKGLMEDRMRGQK